jgi:hypothetical protein
MAYACEEQLVKHSCPGGTWQLSASIRSLLDREVARLPNRDVSDDDTRYPVDAGGMRAFLSTFFTRHLFQLENSLLDYMVSGDSFGTRQVDALRILDVGSGPAVASLALLDIAERVRRTGMGSDLRHGALLRRTVHVLNDTSAVCLATGKHMMAEYLRRKHNHPFMLGSPRIFTLQSPFPSNLHQLRRMASALGGYDIVFLSYVIHPLTETCGLQGFAQAVRALGDLCRPGLPVACSSSRTSFRSRFSANSRKCWVSTAANRLSRKRFTLREARMTSIPTPTTIVSTCHAQQIASET